MNASQTIEYLLKHLYQLYKENEAIRRNGITPHRLIDSSGIKVGDAGAQLATVDRIRSRGWIKIINVPRIRRTKQDNRLYPWDDIQLTEEGIKEAERLLSPFFLRHLREIYVATIEGIARALGKH